MQLADPEKIVVVQIAPAVRAAWGEELGLYKRRSNGWQDHRCYGRRLGADYVFDYLHFQRI